MKSPEYYSRKFINKSTGTALIEIDGSASSWQINLDVNISDCNRKICLDFYASNDKVIKERLAKLDLIISELNKARKFLVDEAIPFFKSENEKKKAETKNEKKKATKLKTLDELLNDD